MQGVWDILQQGASEDAALVVPDGPRFSYRQLRDEVQRAADALCALGVGHGDPVASVFPNGAEAVLAFLASSLSGCSAPLNPGYTEHEFSFYLNDVNARVLLVPAGKAAAARDARPTGTTVVEAFLDPGGRLRLEAEGPVASPRSRTQVTADDVALTLHTSGTTGQPKRVPLQHRHLAASVSNIMETYQLGPTDVSFCVMPLFHVHGLVASALATFGSGGTVVVPAPFNPLRFWSVAAEHGSTWFSAVPTIQRMLLARARSQSLIPTLRFVRTCSAALSPELMADFEERIGVPVVEAYGMTEACHQMASNPLPPGERRAGSVGLPTGVEVAVVDDGWRPVNTGRSGEVVVRGPNVISAYADAPEANADLLRRRLVSDRRRRRARRRRVSEADRAHKGTDQSRRREDRATGDRRSPPQPPGGCRGCRVRYPSPGPRPGRRSGCRIRAQVTEQELIAYCRTRLAAFKVPRTIRIVDQLASTATGKPQRRKVAESLGLGE